MSSDSPFAFFLFQRTLQNFRPKGLWKSFSVYDFAAVPAVLYHESDPAHRILNSSGGNMPTGRPQASDQTEAYLGDMGMTGLESAWAMARRRPMEYRRKVDAATRCPGVCPHT